MMMMNLDVFLRSKIQLILLLIIIIIIIPCRNLNEIIRHLRLMYLSVNCSTVTVRRTDFMEDVLSFAEGFDPAKRIYVSSNHITLRLLHFT